MKCCKNQRNKGMKKNEKKKGEHIFSPVCKVLLAFILISGVGIICSNADESHAQETRLTFSVKNTTLKGILDRIEKSTGFSFMYENNVIDVNSKVDFEAKNESIESVLDRLLSDEVSYRIVGKHILLFRSEKQPAEKVTDVVDVQQQRTVRGKVTDSEGESLPGTTVIIKGSTIGTITDADGNYLLRNVPDDAILVFSFVGMETQEINVGNRTRIDVTLQEEAVALQEVVAVGYGVQRKINLTGAVSHVTSQDIVNKPVANIGQALQGVIPNLNITISSGSLKTNPSFNVRGGTSFSGNSFQMGSPLILVDGVEMDINQLNPEDIESVSVLKDAASAAIYGSRAPYGVMLVTTKRGKEDQKVTVTYSGGFQWQNPTAIPDLLDAYTIQDANIKAYELENKTAPADALTMREKIKAYMDDPENEPIYYMSPGGEIIWVGNTRVYKEAVRNYSPLMKHNLNISGGSKKTTYYGSIGYQSIEGIYKLNTDKNNRYNVLLNLDSEINKWLNMVLKASYTYWDHKEPVAPAGKGGWWYAMSQEPDRNINMPIKTPPYSPVGVMYTDNILAFMDYGSCNKENKETTLLSLSFNIQPLKKWNIKGDIAYKSYDYNQKEVIPLLSRIEKKWDTPTTAHTDPSTVTYNYTHTNQYTINIYTDYNLLYKNHNLYFLAGFNQEWYNYKNLYGQGQKMLTPSIPFISQTLGNEYASDAASEWALRSGFYRLAYNFKEKYLFESNGRYDGTSRFPKDRRFKFFTSFSGGWRISNEPFLSFAKPIVDDLKIRASYGSLGNQNVSNYIYIPTYGTISEVKHLFGGERPVGITPPGLIDPNLTWETATTMDFGCDIMLLRRLEMNFDWYTRTTSDILVAGDKFPAVVGTSAPTKNSGKLQTNGWEFSAKWLSNPRKEFRYDVSFVLSDYQSKIVKFGGNPHKLLNSLYEGQKMGEIWGFETAGIFQSPEEIEKAPSQNDIYSGIWYPGDTKYKDLNVDNKIGYGSSSVDDPGDRKIIGNSTPHYQFGLNSNFFYRNFDFNLFLQGVGKRDYWIGDKFYWGLIGGGTGTWEVYNNSWRPDRPNAKYPAYKNKSANIQVQTKYLQNASYLRIKNLSIGYTLPATLIQKINIDKFRIYCAGYNLFTFSHLPDIYDPELLTANYPILRTFSLGLQITFK